MNFVILTAALSGANADLYAGSRMLFSLARDGWAPAKLGSLNAAGVAEAGAAGFFLRNCGGAGAGKMGAEECVCFHPGRGVVRDDAVVADFAGGACDVSPTAVSTSKLQRCPCVPRWAWGSALGFVLVIVAILESGLKSHLTLISGAFTSWGSAWRISPPEGRADKLVQ